MDNQEPNWRSWCLIDRINNKKYQFGKWSGLQLIAFGLITVVNFGLFFLFSFLITNQNLIVGLVFGAITVPFSAFITLMRHRSSNYPYFKYWWLLLRYWIHYKSWAKDDPTKTKFSVYNINAKQVHQIESQWHPNPDGSYSLMEIDQQSHQRLINQNHIESAYRDAILKLQDLSQTIIYLSGFKAPEVATGALDENQLWDLIHRFNQFFKTIKIPFHIIKINLPLNLTKNIHDLEVQINAQDKNLLQKWILEHDKAWFNELSNNNINQDANWYILFYAKSLPLLEGAINNLINNLDFNDKFELLEKWRLKNIFQAIFNPWISDDDERLDDQNELVDLNPLFEFTTLKVNMHNLEVQMNLEHSFKAAYQAQIDDPQNQHLYQQKRYFNISQLDRYPIHINETKPGWLRYIAAISDICIIASRVADDKQIAKGILHAKENIIGLQKRAKSEIERKNHQANLDYYNNLTDELARNETIIFDTNIFFINYADSATFLDRKLVFQQDELTKVGFRADQRFGQQDKMLHNIFPQTTSTLGADEIPLHSKAFSFGLPFGDGFYNDEQGIYIGPTVNPTTTEQIGIFSFDLFSKKRKNFNQFVIGTSGSGKTTYLKKQLLRQYAKGTTVVTIDPENEYSTMLAQMQQSLNSLYLNQTKLTYPDQILNIDATNTPINPFEINDYQEIDDGQIVDVVKYDLDVKASWLTNWLMALLFRQYQDQVNPNVVYILNQAILKLYQHFQIDQATNVLTNPITRWPTMTDLMHLIDQDLIAYQAQANNDDYALDAIIPALKQIAYQLKTIFGPSSNATEKYLWSGLYIKKALPNLSQYRWINFNIQKMTSADARLRSLLYELILEYSKSVYNQNKLINDQNLKRHVAKEQFMMIVVDEAHLLMHGKNANLTLAWLANCAKRLRKYKGSLIVATQNIHDFLKVGDEAQVHTLSIINNCDSAVFLAMQAGDINFLQSLLAVGEGDQQQFNQLTTPQIHYLQRSDIKHQGIFKIGSNNMRAFTTDLFNDQVLNYFSADPRQLSQKKSA